MWDCVKSCVKEVWPSAGFWWIVGIAAGIVGLIVLPAIATGGASAAIEGLTFAAIAPIVGGTALASAVGHLIGCLIHCV